jgi:hypothetical protein
LPTLARPLKIYCVADAKRRDAIQRQAFSPQNRPDLTRLLTCDRDHHVDIEGRAGERRLNLAAELLFEPSNVVGGRHGCLAIR